MGEAAWWVLQRATGVLLVLPVGIHLFAQATGAVDLTVRFVSDLALLVLVVLHSIPGLRTVVDDYVPDGRLRVLAERLLLLGGAALIGYGAWGLWKFFT